MWQLIHFYQDLEPSETSSSAQPEMTQWKSRALVSKHEIRATHGQQTDLSQLGERFYRAWQWLAKGISALKYFHASAIQSVRGNYMLSLVRALTVYILQTFQNKQKK